MSYKACKFFIFNLWKVHKNQEMQIGKGGRENKREREWHLKAITANTNKAPRLTSAS